MNIIDLHTHSTITDGSCRPKEIIRLADKINLKAVALTDHDSIEGNKEAYHEAEKLGVDFIPGIEISARFGDNRIIHILGYGIDSNDRLFSKVYHDIKKARAESIEKIIKILKEKGIHISYDVLKERSSKQYLDRYDIYKYFLEEKICNVPQGVWDKYLDPIPYGQEELMDAEIAIEIIREAGGLSFLAHYNKKIGFKGYSNYEIENNITNLINSGLNGLESYYPDFSAEDAAFADYLIKKYKILSSGGTDFHGENRPDIELGKGYGDFNVPYELYNNIKRHCQKSAKTI